MPVVSTPAVTRAASPDSAAWSSFDVSTNLYSGRIASGRTSTALPPASRVRPGATVAKALGPTKGLKRTISQFCAAQATEATCSFPPAGAGSGTCGPGVGAVGRGRFATSPTAGRPAPGHGSEPAPARALCLRSTRISPDQHNDITLRQTGQVPRGLRDTS